MPTKHFVFVRPIDINIFCIVIHIVFKHMYNSNREMKKYIKIGRCGQREYEEHNTLTMHKHRHFAHQIIDYTIFISNDRLESLYSIINMTYTPSYLHASILYCKYVYLNQKIMIYLRL